MLFNVLAIIVALVIGVCAFLQWKLTYWERAGVATMKKNLRTSLGFGRQSIFDLYRILKQKKLRHGGVYHFMIPVYVPIDPELIKHILQIDFSHFVNHGRSIDEKKDPLTGHLFNLEDAKWRNMRVKLTPTFTSGKLKMMFPTFVDCAVGLKSIMDESAESKTPVEIKEVMARFTTDIIGSVAFGIECNSLKDPDADFRKYGKKVFETDEWGRLKMSLQFLLSPRLFKALGWKMIKPDVEEFFMGVIRDTVNYREKNNIYRKDFMHLLLQLKNRGTVTDDDKIADEKGAGQEKGLTMNELAAQSYVFFIAGFETSSTTMTFALLEMAMNSDIQDKLRKEINTVLAKYDDQFTYAAMIEMTYLDQVLQETLRKHPPVPTILRQCTKDYIVPGTDVQIKQGMAVFIPVKSIHHDPEYYPDPEVFDPERFSEENKKKRPAFTWFPFGEGPRLCIGMRFGLLQAKVGIATLLKNYKISLNSRTTTPITYDKRALIPAVEGGVWLDVEKL